MTTAWHYLAVVSMVFLANLMPAFAPPTWTILVLFKLNWHLDPVALVVTGALASAGGRYLLAVATGRIRDRLSPRRKASLLAAKNYVTGHKGRALLGLVLFTLSPLPSAQLFEAAGLMGAPLLPVTVVFLAERLVTYSLYIGATSIAERNLGSALTDALTSPYGIAVQLVLILAVVMLARIDWTRILPSHTATKTDDVRDGIGRSGGVATGTEPNQPTTGNYTDCIRKCGWSYLVPHEGETRPMTIKTTVENGDITLPITHTGEGRKLIFFNGAGATQFAWRKVVALLGDRYETVTFDFRGHGEASAATDYSFDAFLSDAEAVMSSEAAGAEPIVVAWSLGADVALAYAAEHPGKLAGLVIVDGAMPISAPLVEDPDKLRHTMDSLAMKLNMLLIQLSPTKRYRMPGSAMADITINLDPRRLKYIDVYKNLDLPITAVLAKQYDGRNNAHTERNKKLWAEAAEQLHRVRPDITFQWIDDTHASLPLKHPDQLAKTINEFARKLS